MKRNTVNGNGEKRKVSGWQRRGEGGSWGQAVLRTLKRLGGEAEGEPLLQEAARFLKGKGIGGTKAIHMDVTVERLVEAGLIRITKGGLYRLSAFGIVKQGGAADALNLGTTFYSTEFTGQPDRDWLALSGGRREEAEAEECGARTRLRGNKRAEGRAAA